MADVGELVDDSSGAILREWDLTTILDPNRTAFTSDHQDWCHANGLACSYPDEKLPSWIPLLRQLHSSS